MVKLATFLPRRDRARLHPHIFTRIVEKATVLDADSHFDDLFDVVPADTPELQRQAYRLRYNFLTVERREPGYEAWRFPDGLEMDPYDAHAVQCLLKYKPTSTWAGMVRLVLPRPEALEAALPVEAVPGTGSIFSTDRYLAFNRRHLAEISRLILAEPFRQRGDNATSNSLHRIHHSQSQSVITHRHRAQLALIGLLAGTLRLTEKNNVSVWVAAMETSLARLLRKLGVEFTPIGKEIYYHGPRRVYVGEVNRVIETLKRTKPDVWSIVSHAAH